MRLAGAAAVVAVSACLVCARAPRAAAEIDYPVRLDLPELDVAVGLTGGVAFGESGTTAHTGALLGVDVGLLHGVLGAHLGVRTQREGLDWRIGGLVEVTAWYVLLVGVGVRFGWMAADGGRDVPDAAVGMTILVAVPFPITRFGDDGSGGALIIAPFGRPGLRFADAETVRGYHEVGVMLRWSSFGF